MENLRSSVIKGKGCINVVKRDATVSDIKVMFCLQDLTRKHSHALWTISGLFLRCCRLQSPGSWQQYFRTESLLLYVKQRTYNLLNSRGSRYMEMAWHAVGC